MAHTKKQKKTEIMSIGTTQDFISFEKTFCREFTITKNRVFNLLGKKANHESGTFREMLLRDFFSNLLPRAVSVDSGFIYGCGKVSNSRQMDIIIWNSSAYPSVFRTSEFVIVPPEAVIAVISVKSKLDTKSLNEGLNNISSIIPLDYTFRSSSKDIAIKSLQPIRKYLIFYETEVRVEQVFKTVQSFYKKSFEAINYKADLLCKLRKYDMGIHRHDSLIEAFNACLRLYLRSIVTINEKAETNFMFFPRENITNHILADPPLLPCLWRQDSRTTSSFAKLVFDVLQAVCIAIGTRAWGSIHTWIEQDPIMINKHNTEELSEDYRILI